MRKASIRGSIFQGQWQWPAIAAILCLGCSGFAFAQEHPGHQRGPGQFSLGLCVGQTLAQEGVTLPAPQPGQHPSLDSATQTAFRNAIQSCRAQTATTAPSPSPSASPGPTDSPLPGGAD